MKDLIENLVSAFSTAFGSTFKSYNFGPVRIPGQSSMPMLTVSPVQTDITNSGTVKDNNLYTVRVVVEDNLKQYFDNVSGEGDTIDALAQLVTWVEDRNADNSVKDATVIGVIRNNLTASGATLYNDNITVDYEDYLVEAEFPKIKATITFVAEVRSTR